MKNGLDQSKDVKNMLDGQGNNSYDNRLKKLEKELSTLRAVLIGYLVGHFLGIILDGLLGH